MFHSMGPNDDPCGHPLLVLTQELVVLPTQVVFSCPEKYDHIKAKALSDSPYSFNLPSKRLGWRESNAFDISVERIPTIYPPSTLCFQSSSRWIRVVSQLYCLWQADWKGSRMSLPGPLSWMVSNFSKILPTALSIYCNRPVINFVKGVILLVDWYPYPFLPFTRPNTFTH